MSLPDAIGAPALVMIAGREFKLAPLTLSDLGIVVRHLRDNAHDPRPAARAFAATLPPDEAKNTVQAAADEYFANTHPTADNALAFILGGSFEGAAWGLWLGLQTHHASEITRDEIYRALFRTKQQPNGQAECEAVIRKLIDAVGLEAAGKNSPPPQANAGANATTDLPSRSTGT